MEGTVASFRRGRRTQNTRQLIIVVDNINSVKKAEKLIGKTVKWQSPGKKILKGKITAAHGSKGAIRALFETGVPGQALSSRVKIE